MRAWIAVFVLLVPATVSAQDIGARITPAGLDTLTGVALARVPDLYSIPAMDPVLFGCPGDDIVARIPDTDVFLTFRELDIRTEDGKIVLSTTLDIDAANTIQIDNVNACLGDAICDVSINIDRLNIVVELGAMTSPDGGIEFTGAMVNLDLAAEDLIVDSVGCAVGDAATWLLDAVETWALDLLTPRLEAAVGDRLSMALSGLFAETVGLTIERDGFMIDGRLESLDFTRALGVTVSGDADVTWTGPAVYEDPPPNILAPEGDALPDDFIGDFQIAASDRLVNEALYEAWRGGLMRRLLADQSRSINLAGDGVASMIGLTGGANLDISFDIESPLHASFGRAAPNVAEIAMNDLHVTVVVTPPGGTSSTIDIYTSGVMQARMTVSQEIQGMVMDVLGMSLSSVRIETSEEDLVLDGARLSAFVTNTISPMLGERLTGLPVAPGLNAVAGMFIHIRAVQSEGGWQRVGADLVTVDLDDFVPPETSFVDPPTLLAAGTAAFEVAGTDNSTPDTLLRYRAWLDGTPLNEGAASGLSTIRFDATSGSHTLEVAAVDLNDNQDPTPVVHGFEVDGNPPDLIFHTSPPAIIIDPAVTATWTATDPEGQPVESRWVLREIGDDGTVTIIVEQPFAADTGALAIATDTLDASTLYEVEIIVRDTAGNVTSASYGFAVQGSSGCNVSTVGHARNGSQTPAFWLGLGVAALVIRRRA